MRDCAREKGMEAEAEMEMERERERGREMERESSRIGDKANYLVSDAKTRPELSGWS